MENWHEDRAQRGHDVNWDANNAHKDHVLDPVNTECYQDYWRKVSERHDHQAVGEHLNSSLFLRGFSMGVSEKGIKNKGITYHNHNNGYYKRDYGQKGEKKCVKKKVKSGKSDCPNPDNDHHPNPEGHVLHIMVGDWMNHSQIAVQTATGHQQGSATDVQGINSIPKCFYWPRLPDQVVQNSRRDGDQEDHVHDGDVQHEETVWREGGSISVHFDNLPEDSNTGRETQNKTEEGGNGPSVSALGEFVT